MSRWLLPVLCLGGLVVGVAWLAGGDRGPSSGPRPPATSGSAGETTAPPVATNRDEGTGKHPPPPTPEDAALSAAELRGRIRASLEARAKAVEELLSPDTSLERRIRLALVLGTITGENIDAALRGALARFGYEPDFARAALLALGAERPATGDDDLFDSADRPFGVTAPGGLGLVIHRRFEDSDLAREVAAYLSRPDPGVRYAAAVTLRHSLHLPRVREAFFRDVSLEKDQPTATVEGEALADAARSAPESERRAILAALIARAEEEDLDDFRFRLENDLAGTPLPDEVRTRLRALAAPARPFSLRTFALTVLAGSAVPSRAVEEVRGLLGDLLRDDGDAAVRDLSARLLGKLPPGEEELARLRRAARTDPAWNVRYTALESLAGIDPGSGTDELLRESSEDPDPRVRVLAEKLLSR